MAATHALAASSVATGSLLATSVGQVDALYNSSIAWLNDLEREYFRGSDSPAPVVAKAFAAPAVGTPVRATLAQPSIPLGRRLNIPIAPTNKADAELVASALNKGSHIAHGAKGTASQTVAVKEAEKAPAASSRAPLTRSNSRNKVAAVPKTAPVPPEPTAHAAAPKAAPAPKAAARSKPAASHAAPAHTAATHAPSHAAPTTHAASHAAPEAKKEEPKLVRQDSRGKRPLLSAVAKERAAKQSKPLALTCTETEEVVAVREAHPPPLLQRARSRKSMSRRSTAATHAPPPAASAPAAAAPQAAPTAPAPAPVATEHAAPSESKAAHAPTKKAAARKSVAHSDKPAAHTAHATHAAPAAASHTSHVPSYAAPTATSASHAAATHGHHTDKAAQPTAAAAPKGRTPAPRAAAVTAAPKAPTSAIAAKKAGADAPQVIAQAMHQTTAHTSSQSAAPPAPAPALVSVPVVVVAPPPAPSVQLVAPVPQSSVANSTQHSSQPSVAPSAASVIVTAAPAPAPAAEAFTSSVPTVPPSELAPVFRNPTALRRRSSRMLGRPVHRRSLAGMDKEVADRMLARYSLPTERAVLSWISAMLNERLPLLEQALADPSQHVRPILGDALHDGQLLCRLANKLRPGAVARFNERRVPLYDRENIQLYLNACARMGLLRQDLFIVSDLYEEKSIPAVLTNLMALGRRFAHVKPALVLPNAEALSLDTLLNEPGQSAAALAADEARRAASEQKEKEKEAVAECAGHKRKDSPVAVAAPAQRRRSDEKSAPASAAAALAADGRVHIVRSEDGAKLGLAQWVKKRVASVDPSLSISNFTSDWQDGRAFCALMASLCPAHFSLRPEQVAAADVKARLAAAFRTAEILSVPQLVDASDFGFERLSMMTYLSEFHTLDGAKKGW